MATFRRYGWVSVRVLYVTGIAYAVGALMLTGCASTFLHGSAVCLALGITFAAGAHARETIFRVSAEPAKG